MYYSELGYDSYDDYTHGYDWEHIKDFFYSLGLPYRCRLCHASKGLLVHKRSYAVLDFEHFKELPKHFIYKILVYLCPRCNKMVHFYKKGGRVPLDYLFLWDREQKIYWRVDFLLRRLIRLVLRVCRWFYSSFRLSRPRQNRRARYLRKGYRVRA